MTADRAKALALIQEMLSKGLFYGKDFVDFHNRATSIEKEFEFEGTIEKSNEVTPDNSVTSQGPQTTQPPATTDTEKGPLDDLPHDQVPKAPKKDGVLGDELDDLPY